MKNRLLLFISILPLLLISCNNDKDKNPWLGHKPKPSGIYEVDGKLGELRDGITRINDETLAFVLYAPQRTEVKLVGDFNDWKADNAFTLHKEGDRFYIHLSGFDSAQQYACQYLIDGKIRIADPYATTILDPNDKYIDSSIYPNLVEYPAGAKNELAMLVSTQQDDYNWKVPTFKVKNPQNMVIYELLIRDFTEKRSIQAVQQKLDYLKTLGVDAIQLMPFNEFEGNDSWGYNPSYYFATDKAYGTPKAYKDFIDECHSKGIAVIMDMVLNHAFDQCALVKLAKDDNGNINPTNPWINVKSPNPKYHWGQDFNHESEVTQAFVDSVCSYWMSEYKVDGFRFDFTKGFTNTPGDGWAYDGARIRILSRMADEIWKRKKDAVVIFEHLTDNAEEKELAELGIYLWGNMNPPYNQTTMGYDQNDLNGTSYTQRGFSTPQLVAYMESHDEERLMFKNLAYGKEEGDYSVKNLETALDRVEAAAAFYFTVPGPKMIWQFGERGYDIELNDDRLARKPPHWEYMEEPARRHLYDRYADFIQMRKEIPAFTTKDYIIDAGEGFIKKILLKHAQGNVCAVSNFDVKEHSVTLDLDEAGNWTDYFSNEVVTTSSQVTIKLLPGEYKIWIQK